MATVLITGANRGIGFSLAKLFVARNDRVIAVCRKSSPELVALGVDVKTGIDVAQDAAIPRLREAIGKTPLDIVINNAGVLHPDSLASLDFVAARQAYEVNSLGPLRVAIALRENLHAGSKLVLISSRVGSIGDNSSGGNYGYRMSKAAVNMAGMNLAIELKPAGVAVAILHPGMVATEMTGKHGISPEESARNLVTRIDALTLETSGRFLHANGEALPW